MISGTTMLGEPEMAGIARPIVRLAIDRSGIDDEAADNSAHNLRQAVLEAGLDGVQEVRGVGASPKGARGDPLSIGAVILALGVAAAPAAVEQLLGVLRDWCGRPGGRPVKLTLKVGDREVSTEYDAARTSQADVESALAQMKGILAG